MPVRANVACASSGALALGLLLAVSACEGDAGSNPRLTPELAESLAGLEAYDSGSNVAIFCDALGFREESRTWLVECTQEKKTSWVIDDQTKDVRPTEQASGSPTETANLGNGGGGTLDGSRLLTSARDRLAICVQAVGNGSMVQAAAKSAVEAALPTLSQSPSWTKYDYSNPPPLVEEGCPPPALYDASLNPDSVASLFDVRARSVSQPSYYRVHVYVIPDDEIARMTVSSTARRTAEEDVCEGDTCYEVTTGLYVSAGELRDTSFMARLLQNAIGLR